ncbi:MAG: hypothetical protein HYZ68_04070 [Chloroflexi bacterium]|nr:hypothetical protein [Chloroflexota bacterium]
MSQRFLKRPTVALYALAAAAPALLYLGTAAFHGTWGFPLDDAWIHQTFARNLAQHGQWAFVPGQPSAGSTSPLWTLLLVPAHLGGLPFREWTYVLGWALLLASGWLSAQLYRAIDPRRSGMALWVGLFIVLEWHLTWAALSGMETTLFIALGLGCLKAHLGRAKPAWVGALAGLATLTRPEGALLFGLLLLDRWRGADRWRGGSYLILGFLLFYLPYLLFHLELTGRPFPNTFYAKHAEYVSAFAPLAWRLLEVPGVTLVGPQVLLLPGFVWAWILASRRREHPTLLLGACWLALLAVYIAYLPLGYQHGRYMIPSIPFYTLLGLRGSFELLDRLRREWRRRIGLLGGLSLALLLLAFGVLGAGAYARDVAFIEGELVRAARWIAQQTPPGALIGAHDIGALGFFAQRPLVDSAGLITPEVIPFIRDEERLLNYFQAREVEYLTFFPCWYPRLAQSPRLRLIYGSPLPQDCRPENDHLAIYRPTWAERVARN